MQRPLVLALKESESTRETDQHKDNKLSGREVFLGVGIGTPWNAHRKVWRLEPNTEELGRHLQGKEVGARAFQYEGVARAKTWSRKRVSMYSLAGGTRNQPERWPQITLRTARCWVSSEQG